MNDFFKRCKFVKRIREIFARSEYIIGGVILFFWIGFVFLYYVNNNHYKRISHLDIQKNAVDYHIDTIDDSDEYITIDGWCVLSGESILTVDISLIFWDKEKEIGYEIPVQRIVRNDVTEAYGDGYNYDNCGFSAIAVKNKLKEGNYILLIQYQNNDNDLVVDTGKVIQND